MSEGTTATWNGKSLNGKKAQTGVYIVFSVGDDGLQKEVTKFFLSTKPIKSYFLLSLKTVCKNNGSVVQLPF